MIENTPKNARPLSPWILASRPKTLPAGVVPVLAGSATAYHEHLFRLGPALAAFIGALFIQIGANYANDVADFQKGADNVNRVGPTRVTQTGLLTARQVKFGAAMSFLVASLAGLYLLWVAGWVVVAIGVTSIIAALTYVGGPNPYGYRGLGDLFVFLFFGLAAVMGTHYVQAKSIDWLPFLGAVSVGSLAVAILVVNNLRDRETDAVAGKRTLAVMFGERAMEWEYRSLVLLAFACPIIGFALRLSEWTALLSLLAFPLALRLWSKIATARGRDLNPVLGATAQLELVFGLLLSLGLLIR